MPVKLNKGPPTYNKGTAPAKMPSKDLYPTKLIFNGDEKVWVSVPQPDKLHLIGDVLPEQFGGGVELTALGPCIMAALASGKLGEVIHTQFTGQYYRQVQIAVGSSGARVFFELRIAPKLSFAAHRLVLHCNPARLGQDGMFDLLNGFQKAVGQSFNIGAFLSASRVTRLDIAVDVVGLSVPNLLATAANAGKRAQYYGGDGVLETVSIHRPQKKDQNGQLSEKAKAAPLGDLALMVYDKRRQQIAYGVSPPFGATNVSRVEVSKRRFGNKKCTLSSLRDLTNPFKGLKVGHVRSAGPKGSWEWLRYVEARRGAGPDQAAFVNNLSEVTKAKFAALYVDHPADVIDASSLWPLWTSGINISGLSYMIEAAEQLCPGVPPPHEAGP